MQQTNPPGWQRQATTMKAAEILTRAAELVGGDRARTHGSKERNHDNIARLWQGYLDIRRVPSEPLSALDAANMMVLLKIARTQLGTHNPDDFVDMAGYAGCAGEIASGEVTPTLPSPIEGEGSQEEP